MATILLANVCPYRRERPEVCVRGPGFFWEGNTAVLGDSEDLDANLPTMKPCTLFNNRSLLVAGKMVAVAKMKGSISCPSDVTAPNSVTRFLQLHTTNSSTLEGRQFQAWSCFCSRTTPSFLHLYKDICFYLPSTTLITVSTPFVFHLYDKCSAVYTGNCGGEWGSCSSFNKNYLTRKWICFASKQGFPATLLPKLSLVTMSGNVNVGLA